MKGFKSLLMTLILFLLCSTLFAQSLNSLDAIGNYALENSTDYKRALLDVLVARNNLEPLIKLEETSFSFSGESKGNDSSSGSSGNLGDWSLAAGIQLPLMDQLSLNAGITDDLNGQFGLSFSPLYHSDNREQLKISYETSLLYAEEMALQTENEALSAALKWMSARRQADLQQEIVAVKEAVYNDQKIRYEAGEGTLDDVRDDLVDWTEARTQLSTRQTLLQFNESVLLRKLSADLDTASMEMISHEDIREAIETLKQSIDPGIAESSGVYSVTAAYKSVESSEERLSDTWIFDPAVNLTALVQVPDMADPSASLPGWELAVELSFSLDDFRFDDRSISRQELQQSQLEAVQAEMESRLTLQQVLISLDNSEQNRVLAELEEEQSANLYDEAAFLKQMGEYSEAELEDARLVYEQSRLNTFSMLVEEYLAWRDLMLYF